MNWALWAEMAGMMTSPQLRESPDTMKRHTPAGNGGAAAGSETADDCAVPGPLSRATKTRPGSRVVMMHCVKCFLGPKRGMTDSCRSRVVGASGRKYRRGAK